MKLIILTFIFVLNFTSSYGQVNKVQGTSVTDLRAGKTIFSIKYNEKKVENYIYLASSSNGSSELTIEVNKKITKNKKIDSGEAKEIDSHFVDSFVDLKYIMKQSLNSKVKCSEKIALNLRGDDLDVCSNDSIKFLKAKKLIEKIKKYMI